MTWVVSAVSLRSFDRSMKHSELTSLSNLILLPVFETAVVSLLLVVGFVGSESRFEQRGMRQPAACLPAGVVNIIMNQATVVGCLRDAWLVEWLLGVAHTGCCGYC